MSDDARRKTAWDALKAVFALYFFAVSVASLGASILFGIGGWFMTMGLGGAAALLVTLALVHHYELHL